MVTQGETVGHVRGSPPEPDGKGTRGEGQGGDQDVGELLGGKRGGFEGGQSGDKRFGVFVHNADGDHVTALVKLYYRRHLRFGGPKGGTSTSVMVSRWGWDGVGWGVVRAAFSRLRRSIKRGSKTRPSTFVVSDFGRRFYCRFSYQLCSEIDDGYDLELLRFGWRAAIVRVLMLYENFECLYSDGGNFM